MLHLDDEIIEKKPKPMSKSFIYLDLNRGEKMKRGDLMSKIDSKTTLSRRNIEDRN